MSIIQAIILGIVQGLTEFIPVSSSGHLILVHYAMGITANGLVFDVALHLGTLLALIFTFYKDIWNLILGLFGKNDFQKLAWLVVIATIPAVFVGWALESKAETAFRSPRLVSINLIIVAGLMILAERYAKNRSRVKLEHATKPQALAIGLAQAAAVIPGISRSGSTITAGLFLGLDRLAATRFSFYLAMPITAGAIAKVLTEGSALNTLGSEFNLFAVGIIAALVSGLLAIRFLLKFLAKHPINIFAYYRIILGVVVLIALAVH